MGLHKVPLERPDLLEGMGRREKRRRCASQLGKQINRDQKIHLAGIGKEMDKVWDNPLKRGAGFARLHQMQRGSRNVRLDATHVRVDGSPHSAGTGMYHVNQNHLLEQCRKLRQRDVVQQAGTHHRSPATCFREECGTQDRMAGPLQMRLPLGSTPLVTGLYLRGRRVKAQLPYERGGDVVC